MKGKTSRDGKRTEKKQPKNSRQEKRDAWLYSGNSEEKREG